MTYHIKPEYFDSWCGGDNASPDRVITQEELEMIARGWETPVEELMEQLTEITE